METKDYIVRGIAANGGIRCFAITSRNLVEEARRRHNTSPVITAALGRLLSGGAMMGAMMKGEKDLLTLQIQCSGPVQGLTVTADAFGHVKGYAVNPVVSLPARKDGKLDVGGALDLGVLTVIKDIGMKEPYSGQVAVGAVVLNRIRHPSFPNTLSGVIYQSGAFTCITDGQFNEPVAESAWTQYT